MSNTFKAAVALIDAKIEIQEFQLPAPKAESGVLKIDITGV